MGTYANVYWAFGGGHRQLVRFDFESDHGPGSMDHSRASVRRYSGLELTRVPGVPSHMSMDGSTRELFIADTGADRIVKVMADTGHYSRDVQSSPLPTALSRHMLSIPPLKPPSTTRYGTASSTRPSRTSLCPPASYTLPQPSMPPRTPPVISTRSAVALVSSCRSSKRVRNDNCTSAAKLSAAHCHNPHTTISSLPPPLPPQAPHRIASLASP